MIDYIMNEYLIDLCPVADSETETAIIVRDDKSDELLFVLIVPTSYYQILGVAIEKLKIMNEDKKFIIKFGQYDPGKC